MNQKTLFIDSGALVAVVNHGDQYEKIARAAWEQIAQSGFLLISTEHVLDEVATAICRTQSPKRAAQWVRLQLETGLIHWAQPLSDDILSATIWLDKLSDQKINFTDSLSFSLMKRLNIQKVFSFDKHFIFAGFELFVDTEF